MKTILFRGMRIRIENEAGSVRSGVDRVSGKPWSTKMPYAYGEIVDSHGVDGDPVDVFIGPDKGASFVQIVHQLNHTTGEFDEDKCFLGFDHAMDAKAAYYKAYDNPNLFYGSIETMPIEAFKKRVKTSNGDTMIRGAWDGISVTKGDPVTVDGLQGRGVVVADDGDDVVVKFRGGLYVKRNKMFVHSMKENTYKSNYVSAGGVGSGCHGPNCGRPALPFKPGSGTEKLFNHLSDGHWATRSFLEGKNGSSLDERIGRINYHGQKGGWHIENGPNDTMRLVTQSAPVEKPKSKQAVKEASTAKEKLTQMITQAMGKEPTPVIKAGIEMMAQKGIDSRLITGLKGVKVGSLNGASGLYEEKGHKNVITVTPTAGPSTFVHEFGHHMDYQWLKDVDTKKASPLLNDEVNKLREDMHTEFWNEKQKVFGGNAPKTGGFQATYNKHVDAVSNYALQNNREWFAENWRVYYHHPEQFESIKDKFPSTYKLVSGLAKGEFFK